jgi:hypothetical protein
MRAPTLLDATPNQRRGAGRNGWRRSDLIGRLFAYYDDGSDALRLEKRLN